MSLLLVRVALTHFVLSSYKWALRLPTSLLISGLARLGVKPRLSRSSWRAYESTLPLMISSWEIFFAFPPCFPLSLPSFNVQLSLSSTFSLSDPPFFRQGAALAHLDFLQSHDLMALCLFHLPKTALASLPTAHFCSAEATFWFSTRLVCSFFC